VQFPACYICQEERVQQAKAKLCPSCQEQVDEYANNLRTDFAIRRAIRHIESAQQRDVVEDMLAMPVITKPAEEEHEKQQQEINWDEEWERIMSSNEQILQSPVSPPSMTSFDEAILMQRDDELFARNCFV